MPYSDVMAGLALVVSLFSLYWTSLRSACIRCPPPRVIAFLKNRDDGGWCLATTLYLANQGARPADFNYFHARILTAGRAVLLKCVAEKPFRQIVDSEFVMTQETCPLPFSLPSHANVTKHLYFVATEDDCLPTGEFTVEFLADIVGRSKETILAKRKIHLKGILGRGHFVEGVAWRNVDVVEIQAQPTTDALQASAQPAGNA